MPEQDDAAGVIDRIITRAHIPSSAERDDLRRELLAHFEDASEGPDGVSGAIERFGPEALLVRTWREVYRRDHLLLYFAKLLASVVACVAAALAIQVIVNLRVTIAANAWRLTPNFPHAAAMSVIVALGLIVAREAGRRPLTLRRAGYAVLAYAVLCATFQLAAAEQTGLLITATMLAGVGCASATLGRWPWRVTAALVGFAGTLYLRHLNIPIDFGPTRATITGCEYLAVWLATLVILSGFDHAFRSILAPRRTA